MRILMAASEVAPFAKTGGLSDVLGALPAALAKLGEEVAVVLPKYRSVHAPSAKRIWDVMQVAPATSTTLPASPARYAAIDEVVEHGVRIFLVDCPALYDRAGIYNDGGDNYPDNHIRFAALCRATLGIARDIFVPDVIHAHDWQTGLLAPLLRAATLEHPSLIRTRSVYTIHNLGYQGNFLSQVMGELALPPALFHVEGLEFWDQVSFMKSGIVWSDAVTTVSPTYAAEIQTPEYGFGMDGVLRDHASKLHGILNGVDYSVWDPTIDPHLAAPYSEIDLSGKAVCKKGLLREMGLPFDSAADLSRPLIGIVSRFAEQKGFDLIEAIAPWLMTQNIGLVVLGSGDAGTQNMFRDLAAAHPDKVAVRIGYNDALAHRIEAGADIFLMPSRYEPCGLNQIYSLRYGTVPVVRATGGLDDTVDEWTGFKFRPYRPEALQSAIVDALTIFDSPESWTALVRRGMRKDYSWGASAKAYQKLYESL
jgi:starch synthase